MSVAIMTIDELIERETAPQSFDWWGHHYENVTPALATKALGDGAVLLGFRSMDTRPNHWLIRVDSDVAMMDSDELSEYVQTIVIDALVNEFGECDDDCEQNCGCVFPTLILQAGAEWWVVQP